MSLERTLSIIKPDAVKKNIIGKVISYFEENSLYVIAIKMLQLTKYQAEVFYDVHRNKDFFYTLINFIVSGPLVVQILEGDNAIYINRKIIGITNPKYALSGTLRSDYGDNIVENIVHGSDSLESSIYEISYFFNKIEIYSRNLII